METGITLVGEVAVVIGTTEPIFVAVPCSKIRRLADAHAVVQLRVSVAEKGCPATAVFVGAEMVRDATFPACATAGVIKTTTSPKRAEIFLSIMKLYQENYLHY